MQTQAYHQSGRMKAIQQAQMLAMDHGITLPGFKGWITNQTKRSIANDVFAMDANLVTVPNTTVPADLLGYYDPKSIDILLRPRKARAIFGEVVKGDWTTPFARFRTNEVTGSTQPYTDYGQSRTSGVNYNWITVETYLFQTVIQYGDFESAVSAVAKVNLAADKQRAAATIIDVDANQFYLFGVSGRKIYGLLNAPSLTAPIAPAPTGTGNSPLWANKTTAQQWADILLLFQQLVKQTDGYVDNTTPIKLIISPELDVLLGKATDFNVSVMDMARKYFTNLTIVTLPEMSNETTGETMMMVADEVGGVDTGELATPLKLRAGRIIPDLSSFSQKWTSGTYGALIYFPLAIAQMRGM